jgi:integrase
LINVNDGVIEYDPGMSEGSGNGRRARGHIRKRGRSYQVLVYAGTDPVTGKWNYLTESTTNEKQAQKILRRLTAQVEEQRVAQTKATLGTAMDAWLKIHEVEANTLRGYEANARRYIKPALGEVPLGKVTAQVLEVFYAELRRCRARCGGRPMIDHWADGEHECRVVRHRNPVGRPPKGGHQNHDCTKMRCEVIECQPHLCRPLAASTIRDIHFTISATLAAAVRWEWIKSNPATVARKPRKPTPEPQPPTPEQAAQIVDAAWQQDEDWGTFVWLTMVTGMRRAELLGLRWHHVHLDRAVLEIRRNYVWVNGRAVEKDTKTHRMRRIALDSDTVELLAAHRRRYEDAIRSVRKEPSEDAFVFSHQAAHDRPYSPDWVTHRYANMCAKLGIDSHLHAMRHYTTTELLTAGVDLRTVAGRLGHGGGGATTLRVYAAWVDASDQHAAKILGGRVQRPDRRT